MMFRVALLLSSFFCIWGDRIQRGDTYDTSTNDPNLQQQRPLRLEPSYSGCPASVKVDLALLVDATSSMATQREQLSTGLISTLLDTLGMSFPGSRVGILSFRDKPEVYGMGEESDFCVARHLKLTQYYTEAASFFENGLKMLGGGTKTEDALTALVGTLQDDGLAWTKSSDTHPNSEEIVVKIVLLITDADAWIDTTGRGIFGLEPFTGVYDWRQCSTMSPPTIEQVRDALAVQNANLAIFLMDPQTYSNHPDTDPAPDESVPRRFWEDINSALQQSPEMVNDYNTKDISGYLKGIVYSALEEQFGSNCSKLSTSSSTSTTTHARRTELPENPTAAPWSSRKRTTASTTTDSTLVFSSEEETTHRRWASTTTLEPTQPMPLSRETKRHITTSRHTPEKESEHEFVLMVTLPARPSSHFKKLINEAYGYIERAIHNAQSKVPFRMSLWLVRNEAARRPNAWVNLIETTNDSQRIVDALDEITQLHFPPMGNGLKQHPFASAALTAQYDIARYMKARPGWTTFVHVTPKIAEVTYDYNDYESDNVRSYVYHREPFGRYRATMFLQEGVCPTIGALIEQRKKMRTVMVPLIYDDPEDQGSFLHDSIFSFWQGLGEMIDSRSYTLDISAAMRDDSLQKQITRLMTEVITDLDTATG